MEGKPNRSLDPELLKGLEISTRKPSANMEFELESPSPDRFKTEKIESEKLQDRIAFESHLANLQNLDGDIAITDQFGHIRGTYVGEHHSKLN